MCFLTVTIHVSTYSYSVRSRIQNNINSQFNNQTLSKGHNDAVSDVDLVNKLDVAEQKLRPPPPPTPPPPPPPSIFNPLRLLIKKKPVSGSSPASATSRAGSPLCLHYTYTQHADLFFTVLV